MKAAVVKICLMFIVCGCLTKASAQEPTPTPAATTETVATGETRASEQRVPLAQQAVALDIEGRAALAGLLRTTQLAGTPDAPERNSRIVIENRSPRFYTYVSGWATFYGADGVRCGEGLWKLEALAPQESAEVETPGLRLTCAPSTWRIVATNLLTRAGDTAKPGQSAPAQTDMSAQPSSATDATATSGTTTAAPVSNGAALPPLEINVNGRTIPIQPGNPLELTVGKERVRIIVQPVP